MGRREGGKEEGEEGGKEEGEEGGEEEGEEGREERGGKGESLWSDDTLCTVLRGRGGPGSAPGGHWHL